LVIANPFSIGITKIKIGQFMETNNKIQKTEKQALDVFVSLAGLVYASALTYCYITKRLDAMAIVAGAVLILGVLVIKTYKSINKT
jgi:hypothetical protein